MLLMCCHPALTPASAIALTLRAVGGLTTAEIATALPRARGRRWRSASAARSATLRTSGAPFALPAERRARRPGARVPAVALPDLQRGLRGSAGAELHRTELSAEAIRLARLVHRLLPDDAEVDGAARADAAHRRAAAGAGRRQPASWCRWPSRTAACWDRGRDRRGHRPARRDDRRAAAARRVPAAGRDRRGARPGARRRRRPTGRRSLALYGLLEEVAPSPFVTLARAVALAEAEGPEAAAPVLDGLDSVLGDHQRLHAVRGHVAELRGDRAAARRHYLAAAARATNLAEQRHLTRLAAAALHGSPRSGAAGPDG